ncbi:MAG: hypothetical protein JO255_03535, partial [Alphaproteobacteria bacterium]|nr:hypothetical protein [Alphaproteobacteria bacterium]
LTEPREVFKSEQIGGGKPYLVNLGDMAFDSPTILGGAARQAGISCSTCHVQGASNPKLFVPGMSTRPGNFDTTGPLFNPKANNFVLDPVTIPSLRGARYLAPYGHDGRMGSLRDFVRNVIVNEFAGPEPSPAILDALVAYIQDIDFLPNPRLAPGGKLAAKASDAERRGEALFMKPFPQDPSLSCAGCHQPTGLFVDHQQHDVGAGGAYKTPTLLNANFNAPYFHDGRYDTYGQVVAHFDRVYSLGLSAQDREDLVAYLEAVGDGERPYEPNGVIDRLTELHDFVSVLDTALPAHDREVISLTVSTVGGELRELAEAFPDKKDTALGDGADARRMARAVLKEMAMKLRRIDIAAAAGQFDEAATIFKDYQSLSDMAALALPSLQHWSLFNPALHDQHYAALRHIVEVAGKMPPSPSVQPVQGGGAPPAHRSDPD